MAQQARFEANLKGYSEFMLNCNGLDELLDSKAAAIAKDANDAFPDSLKTGTQPIAYRKAAASKRKPAWFIYTNTAPGHTNKTGSDRWGEGVRSFEAAHNVLRRSIGAAKG